MKVGDPSPASGTTNLQQARILFRASQFALHRAKTRGGDLSAWQRCHTILQQAFTIFRAELGYFAPEAVSVLVRMGFTAMGIVRITDRLCDWQVCLEINEEAVQALRHCQGTPSLIDLDHALHRRLEAKNILVYHLQASRVIEEIPLMDRVILVEGWRIVAEYAAELAQAAVLISHQPDELFGLKLQAHANMYLGLLTRDEVFLDEAEALYQIVLEKSKRLNGDQKLSYRPVSIQLCLLKLYHKGLEVLGRAPNWDTTMALVEAVFPHVEEILRDDQALIHSLRGQARRNRSNDADQLTAALADHRHAMELYYAVDRPLMAAQEIVLAAEAATALAKITRNPSDLRAALNLFGVAVERFREIGKGEQARATADRLRTVRAEF